MSGRHAGSIAALAAVSLASVLVMTGFGLWGGASDRSLARTYGAALSAAAPEWPATRRGDVWLSNTGEGRALLRRPLVVGDRVTISGPGGQPDVYEVIGLHEIGGDSVDMPGLRLQVVTGRQESSVGGESVRMLFAVEGSATAPVAPKPAKHL